MFADELDRSGSPSEGDQEPGSPQDPLVAQVMQHAANNATALHSQRQAPDGRPDDRI